MGFAAIGSSSSPPLRAFSIPNSSCVEDGQTQVAELASPCPHKWSMVIAYDGTKFKGWQYQPSPPTIQCLVENALICITKLDQKELCLVGAGRTDTGVHAWAQVAHFTTPFIYNSLESLHAAINGLLPPDIQVALLLQIGREALPPGIVPKIIATRDRAHKGCIISSTSWTVPYVCQL